MSAMKMDQTMSPSICRSRQRYQTVHSILAKPRRALHDCVKDRLNIRRRAGDDAKISLVAVCCSNASLSSLNSRTFSMAMTA